MIQCKTSASGFEHFSQVLLSVVQISPLLPIPYRPSLSASPLEISSTLTPFPSIFLEDVGATFLVSVFGEHFGTSKSIDEVKLDSTNCWPLLWTSDSSLLCSLRTLNFVSNRVEVSLKSQITNEVRAFFNDIKKGTFGLILYARFL